MKFLEIFNLFKFFSYILLSFLYYFYFFLLFDIDFNINIIRNLKFNEIN